MPFNFPNNPTLNQQVTGPNGAVWSWDGVKWQAAPGALTQTAVVFGDVAPSNPYPGLLWFDSLGGNTYVWYPDPTGACWALAVSPPFPPAQTAAGNTGRNLIHNPLFNIAQRGAGPFTSIGNFTLDRWKLNASTDTASYTQTALADTDRAAIGDEAARFTLQNTFTGNAAGYNFATQAVEDIRRLAGKTVTVSFYAKTTAGTPKLGINIMQDFGSGGSPTGARWCLATGASVTLATTWARYSVTVPVTSIAGTTLGTNGNDSNVLAFWYSSGAGQAANAGNIGVQSGTVQLWGVQLEIGSGYGFPTPLAKRDPADEMALCQRFYQLGQSEFAMYNTAGNVCVMTTPLPVTMRAIPTLTLGSWTTQTNCTTPGLQSFYPYSMRIYANATAAGVVNLAGTWAASADL